MCNSNTNRSFLQLIKTMKCKREQKKGKRSKKSKKSKYEQEYLNESVQNAENYQSSGAPAECEKSEHEAKTETQSAMTKFDRTEKDITPMGGFPHKEDDLLIKGCSVESKKPVMTILRQRLVEPTSRPAMKEINLKFIDPCSTGRHTGFGHFSEKAKFYGRTSRF